MLYFSFLLATSTFRRSKDLTMRTVGQIQMDGDSESPSTEMEDREEESDMDEK